MEGRSGVVSTFWYKGVACTAYGGSNFRGFKNVVGKKHFGITFLGDYSILGVTNLDRDQNYFLPKHNGS